MPTPTPPRTWSWPDPITPLVRASRPFLITHSPSPNHLIGDRVNTENFYHHGGGGGRASQSSSDTSAPLPGPPPKTALHWLGPNSPQRPHGLGGQLLTSLGPSLMSSAGLVLEQAHLEGHGHCQGHAGSGTLHHLKMVEKQHSLLISPSHTREPPGVLGIPQHPMHNLPQFSLYIAMLRGGGHSPTLKGLHTPSPAPKAR